MLRIIVDSGSSIKQEEKALYGVDILPLRVQIDDMDFQDGVDLTTENFYQYLDAKKEFPKTSLPSLNEAQSLVEQYTESGDDVLILTISSEISGTYQSLLILFQDNPKVIVFDTKLAAGGIRFLVEDALRYKDAPLFTIKEKLEELIPRIVIMAIPNTLDYLLVGGRLSKAEWMLGTLLSIKPIIGFRNGKVAVLTKKRGLKQSMQAIVDEVSAQKSDPDFGIIASYTQNKENVEKLIAMTVPEYRRQVKVYDNLTPSLACHWGPNAYGYIFVKST